MIIIIVHSPPNSAYRLFKTNYPTAELLADFLTADVGCRANSFIEDFEDDEYHEAAMNATQFTKEYGIVTITPEYVIDEEESIAVGNFFSIKAIVLAELLRQWQIVYAKHPTYITITIADNIVHVIGSDTLPNH